MSGDELPIDFEPCGECGFDHGYEAKEAYQAHTEMKVMDLHAYLEHVEEQDGYCFNCKNWTMLGNLDPFSEGGLCPLCLTYQLDGSESNRVVDHIAPKD